MRTHSCNYFVMDVSIYPDSPRRVRAAPRRNFNQFGGNGNVDNRADFGSVVSFLCPKVTVVPTVSFATKNETTESIAAALEQSALHLFLAANAPATLSIVS